MSNWHSNTFSSHFPEEYLKNKITFERLRYYRETYKNSILWDSNKSLKDKTLIIYCEQGNGDIIQFSRYFKKLKEQGCYLIAHCPKGLHKILSYCNCVDLFLDKNDPNLPEHDFHVTSMSLSFLLKDSKRCIFPDEPYIFFNETIDLEYSGLKIGIAWEGSPTHECNKQRSCPLKHFKKLDGRLFVLQKEITKDFIEETEDMELYSVPINDFVDTARLINSVDLVVSVDTSVIHLAGALNKKGYCLLSKSHDFRWSMAQWYRSIRVIKQKNEGNWESLFVNLRKELST